MNPPSSTTASNDDAAPWSRHWQQTLQGSINLAGGDPVASALRQSWAAQVPTLQSCPRVADIGSGPAILARLMLQLGWKPRPDAVWWCVDHAALTDGWRHSLPDAVRVLDRTDFATTPPPDGPMDALVSNFGLEYVSLTAVAQALPLWLKPKGRLRAVMHAQGSVIDQASRESADDLHLALQEVNLHALALPLVRDMASAPTDPVQRMMHGVDSRDAYNAGVDRLKQAMEERGRASPVLMDLLRAATQVLRQLKDTGETVAMQALQQQRDTYLAEWNRLKQMMASALSEGDAQRWVLVLREAGLTDVRLQRLECPLGLVGWNIQAGA